MVHRRKQLRRIFKYLEHLVQTQITVCGSVYTFWYQTLSFKKVSYFMENISFQKSFQEAKLLLKQRHYYKAINLLKGLLISSEIKTERNAIYFALFDAFLSVGEFLQADETLRSLLTESTTDKNELEYREDLLNSYKAKRYAVTLEILDSVNVHLLQDTKFSYIKGIDLINFQICFDYKLLSDNIIPVAKSHSDDLIKFTDVIPTKTEDDNSRYNLSINALFVDKIGVYDKVTDSIKWLISIKSEGIINVIRGKEGWLFLNNDTNNSVSQFKGDYLISNDEIDKWKYYLSTLERIDNAILLIPPSKEMVFSEYYPYSRGKVCPIDQLSKLVGEYNVDYCYPIDILKGDLNSYSKTETHWSNKAACDVILKILSKLKIDISNFKNPYTFELIEQVGDLGSKLQPPEMSYYYKYKNEINNADILFSNVITTQGSIVKYFNRSAFIDKSIVIFGDSFIECCLSLITSIFTKVVKIRSNATLIKEVIDYEKPDCVLAEITERFIVRAPRVLKNIKDYAPTMRTNNLSTMIWSKLIDYNVNADLGIYNNYMLEYKNVIEMTRFDSLSQNEKNVLVEVDNSGLFDKNWYSDHYKCGLHPLLHYVYVGWKKGYNPSELFDTNFYLNKYSDVKNANICPLVHFVKYGRKEGRKIMDERSAIETEITNIKNELSKLQMEQDNLNSRLNKLLEQKKNYESKEIMDAYLKSGKSYQELMIFLNQKVV